MVPPKPGMTRHNIDLPIDLWRQLRIRAIQLGYRGANGYLVQVLKRECEQPLIIEGREAPKR
jgi:hypothetical protein